MSKQRMVNTRFWVDPWVQEELNSLDRLLFLYLLTNDQTNLSGIYEISNFNMCFETGIEKETLLRAMFPRLAPKVYREGNWVILINFPKHQNTNNPSIVQGILRELELVPDEVVKKAIEYGYSVPLGYKKGGTRGVEGTPNLTKLNLTKPIGSALEDEAHPIEVVEVPDTDILEESEAKRPRVSGNKRKAYDELIAWSEKERGFPFLKTKRGKQYAAFRVANENGLTRDQLIERWEEMSTEKFWKQNGYDWMNVVDSFNTKPV
jgi:hypothetical protein